MRVGEFLNLALSAWRITQLPVKALAILSEDSCGSFLAEIRSEQAPVDRFLQQR